MILLLCVIHHIAPDDTLMRNNILSMVYIFSVYYASRVTQQSGHSVDQGEVSSRKVCQCFSGLLSTVQPRQYFNYIDLIICIV